GDVSRAKLWLRGSISIHSNGAMATEQRRQFGPESLEEALDLARQCARLKEEWTELDNTWEEALRLRHLLYLAAKPDFVPPARFQQAMETCVECLLAGSGGSGAGNASLLSPERLLQLLDSPDALPLLQYLSWLEEALKEITSGDGPSGSSFRTVLVPQRAKGALKSWPAERSLLQQSACALWEALLLQGPKHLRHAKEWQEALQERQAIQRHQTEECQRVARELHETAGFFVAQVEEHSGAEWPELARVTQESLWRVQQVAGDLLQNQKECWSQAMEDYEAFASRVSSCRASLQEVRRQVRRHEQAFSQAAQRFTEVANQLVAWTSVLVPKLRVLEAKRAELREALELRKRLPLLEREHMHAEDELDTAQTELRKQKRRQASSQRRGEAATAGYILEHQCELRVAHAQKRAEALQEELRDAERRLQGAEASLPLQLNHQASGTASSAPVDSLTVDPHLTNEERLALKLATLQQFHEEMVAVATESQAEHEKMLRKVEQRKVQAAIKQAVEPDFMCPILHERMKVPVLAADGFTYERQAIEKWLSMHNTSPMTGAVLAHRYLTENFALRHLIEAYESQLSDPRTRPPPRRGGVALKTCDLGDLSDDVEISEEDEDPEFDEDSEEEVASRRVVRVEED
ncbi:unnamed protein product, partial [Effrenium voratum]